MSFPPDDDTTAQPYADMKAELSGQEAEALGMKAGPSGAITKLDSQGIGSIELEQQKGIGLREFETRTKRAESVVRTCSSEFWIGTAATAAE